MTITLAAADAHAHFITVLQSGAQGSVSLSNALLQGLDTQIGSNRGCRHQYYLRFMVWSAFHIKSETNSLVGDPVMIKNMDFFP